ncbi:hypothetical protein IFM89_032979 [Coptis chinensis]|uniref:KIB1-4 beta-propeller domain-containing protein n=1 Tax=Coptis chinensis TaxID=261450 RepID=A0A835HQB3_9MAGN|nr:hypothetical protein IFM89_032979 [Coptis chinensis]
MILILKPFNLFIAASEVHKLELPKAEQCLWKGSSRGWLVQLEDSPSINLINPLTSTRMQLPPLTTFPNVLEYIPERIGSEYSVMMLKMKLFSLVQMKHFCIKKLVLSSSPKGKNCIAMAIYGDCNKLAWCRIGDEGWKTVEGGWCFIDDIIHFDGKFYALDYTGTLIILPDEEVGASCPKATLFAKPPNPDEPDFASDNLYLVESSGELLMVDRIIESGWKKFDTTVGFESTGLLQDPRLINILYYGIETSKHVVIKEVRVEFMLSAT